MEAERLLKIKAEQEQERELVLQQEKLKRLEAEEEIARKEKLEEEERLKEEEMKMKEWERKFDEEQRIKEEALLKNFYEDTTNDTSIENTLKSDNELNKDEIRHEGYDINENSK